MTKFNGTISTLNYDLTTVNSVITARWRYIATDEYIASDVALDKATEPVVAEEAP